MITRTGLLIASACILQSISSRPALADNQSLYTELVAAGYEIKNVSFLSPDFTSRYATKFDPQDTVVITLQKGASSAACFWYASAWITQDLATRKCSVFK